MGNRDDALDMLRDALEQLREVNETLRQANRILKDSHAQAYLLDHLRIMTDSDHGFLSRDYSLEQWIADLEKGKLDD